MGMRVFSSLSGVRGKESAMRESVGQQIAGESETVLVIGQGGQLFGFGAHGAKLIENAK